MGFICSQFVLFDTNEKEFFRPNFIFQLEMLFQFSFKAKIQGFGPQNGGFHP